MNVLATASALICSCALGTPALAAPLDLASYLALTPGNWGILENTKTGERIGYVTSRNDEGQIVQTWYDFEGGVWVPDGKELFKVTNRKVMYLGSDDGSEVWLAEPAVSMARHQEVGDITVYKGLIRNQTTGEAEPVTNTLTITAAGFAASVPAGNYSNCIKLRHYKYSGGGSRDSVSINCPGRLEAKIWYNKINDTGVPSDIEQDRAALVMVQGGDSSPPLP